MSVMNRIVIASAGLLLCLGNELAPAEEVAVVSARNPVATLTKDQVADIFLGKTGRFPNGSQAIPIDQSEGSPARDEFYLKFAGKSPAQVKAYWSKIIFTGRGQPPREVSNGAEAKRHVAADPNAITYIDRAMVDASVKVPQGQ